MRDAVKTRIGAQSFSEGLYDLIHGAWLGKYQIRGKFLLMETNRSKIPFGTGGFLENRDALVLVDGLHKSRIIFWRGLQRHRFRLAGFLHQLAETDFFWYGRPRL